MAFITNLCAEIMLPTKQYRVDKDYPYDCLKIEDAITRTANNPFNKYNYFDRRIDAEKYRLERLIEANKDVFALYDIGGHVLVRPCKYTIQLENIEEEHPEWMI